MAMAMTTQADPRLREGQLLYCTLLPLFLASEGARRIVARLKSNDQGQVSIRRNWIGEARSQTCVATSYALMATSMLQSSERRRRPERLS
jgi:hypothetical protein